MNECRDLCELLNIPDITHPDCAYSKNKWKQLVKESVLKKNTTELKDKMNGYSKLEAFKNEETCELKEYFQTMTMEEARTNFRVRSMMVKCGLNQPNDPRNIATLWKCSACSNVDSQSHIIWCPAYQKLREGKSLDNERDIVQYFQKVMAIREKLDLRE